MAEEKPKRQRKKRSSRDVEAGMEDDYSMVDGLIDNPLAPMQPLPGQVAMHPHEHLQMVPGPHQVPNGFYQRALITGPGVVPESRPPMLLERTEEELDDGDDTEWVVKIGNEPPPLWGKRKASEEPEDQKQIKKGRNDELSLEQQAQLSTQELMAIANIHILDHTIRDIAKEYRFTVEEVKEFYDKCGEMGRTKERFRKMRELLQEKFGSDG